MLQIGNRKMEMRAFLEGPASSEEAAIAWLRECGVLKSTAQCTKDTDDDRVCGANMYEGLHGNKLSWRSDQEKLVEPDSDEEGDEDPADYVRFGINDPSWKWVLESTTDQVVLSLLEYLIGRQRHSWP